LKPVFFFRKKAYIFYRSDTTWSQQASLIASDGAAGDNFGKSVSVSGNVTLVGADRKDVGDNDLQGKSYFYIQH